MHYGVGVVPARPYKPRDKAKVESGVQIVGALDHGGAAQSAVSSRSDEAESRRSANCSNG